MPGPIIVRVSQLYHLYNAPSSSTPLMIELIHYPPFMSELHLYLLHQYNVIPTCSHHLLAHV